MTFSVGDKVVFVENVASVVAEETGWLGPKKGLIGQVGTVVLTPVFEDGAYLILFYNWDRGHCGDRNLGNSGYFVHSSFLEPVLVKNLSYEEML